MKTLLTVSMLATALVGCDELPEEEDTIDDSFVGDGKADTFGIAEGSPEALGVLQLVNTTSYSNLTSKVHVAAKATASIIDYRESYDQLLDSLDDRKIRTLVELDERPWVGKVAFQRLLSYAEDNGYVTDDPIPASSCTGTGITLAELQALTVNGTQRLPTGSTVRESRQCNGALGCGPWGNAEKLGVPTDSAVSFNTTGSDLVVTAGLASRVPRRLPQGMLDENTNFKWTFRVTFPAGKAKVEPVLSRFDYWFGSNVTETAALEDVSITFTNHCLRATGRVPLSGMRERRVAFLVNY